MANKTNIIKELSAEECNICKIINEAPKQPKRPWDKKRIAVVGIFSSIAVGSVALTVPFIAPAFRRVCIPYVPATTTQVENVMAALKGRSGSLLDIGSGDGRVVIEASKHGFQGYGVELNRWLVLWSQYSSWRQGVNRSTRFFKQDLWKTDMSKYDNIVVFGVDTLMDGLEKKFEQEIKPESRVLVSRFPLPNWSPVSQTGSGLDAVWVYMRPDNPGYDQRKISKDTVKKNYEQERYEFDIFSKKL
ncbi:ACKMT-like protein [Mya arenaria]|uniref:ACKMT-like protein n=1 Tax=Mya arenaria TaxID=6604 RepID=A0ABY7ECV5_MYAAR|nr:ATP synthase subunit C lysine N-methyltransferase-like [Mya arenaria]WAR06541.1 ACKMT-like protein [Mya arenaria]